MPRPTLFQLCPARPPHVCKESLPPGVSLRARPAFLGLFWGGGQLLVEAGCCSS